MSGIPNKFYIGSWPIHFYGIIIAFSMIVAIFVSYFLFSKRAIKRDLVFDFALVAIPFGIIGARLFYVLFSGYSYTFSEAIAIWDGGMSIMGAVIFGAAAVFVLCKIKKISFLKIADAVAPGLILAQAIGRWGNFFNQEAYGPVITNPKFQWFPFGVNIESDMFGGTQWHCATFFYESLWNLFGFIFLIVLICKITSENKAGVVASVYFMWYGFGRFWVEMLRQDPLVIFGEIRFSKVLAFVEFVIGVVLFIVIMLKSRKKEKNYV